MDDNLKFTKVVVGGTFDLFHDGHEALFNKALEIGYRLLIGLTTDKMVTESCKSHKVSTYCERKKRLINFFDEKRVSNRFEIVPINDPYGPSTKDHDIDAIVVSQERAERAEEINRIRLGRRLKPLNIVIIDMVLAEDGFPISTTRIKSGEIDRKGHLL
jgi:pantetheine-phosphate adenylyltransferase